MLLSLVGKKSYISFSATQAQYTSIKCELSSSKNKCELSSSKNRSS